MHKIVVANWKLHPETKSEAIRLARAIDKKGVIICPPFPFLDSVRENLLHALLGAQDTFWEEKGPYTGEVSPAMLKDIGARYVILGHSERRNVIGETDAQISKKAVVAIWAGLKVILCVGEPLSVRKRGLAAAKNFVQKQLKEDLKWVKRKDVIIAYEPIWAIGSGKADKPEEAAEMARHIKRVVGGKAGAHKVKVLYGGSVNKKNGALFLKQKDIDGALVGGASLRPRDFVHIVQSVT